MSIFYKDNSGKVNRVASHLIQRVNARWFLCQRVMEDGQEYYDVPELQTLDYFSAISPFTIYSFGFSEPNTTQTPKLRYKGVAYNILDVTALESDHLGVGQLKGVYQMFTQESSTDKSIYFIGNMHTDYSDLSTTISKTIALGMDGVIEANRVVFTVQDADSYVQFITNLREFFINAHLPIVVPSLDDFDTSLPIAITFGDTTYNLYNYLTGGDTPMTLGDLMSVANYDQTTGFFFNFNVTFFENSDIVGFAIVPPAVSARQLEPIIEDSDTIVTDLNEDGTKLSIHLSGTVMNKINKALITPMSTPASTEIVAVDETGAQTMLALGSGLYIEGNELRATGGSETGGTIVTVGGVEQEVWNADTKVNKSVTSTDGTTLTTIDIDGEMITIVGRQNQTGGNISTVFVDKEAAVIQHMADNTTKVAQIGANADGYMLMSGNPAANDLIQVSSMNGQLELGYTSTTTGDNSSITLNKDVVVTGGKFTFNGEEVATLSDIPTIPKGVTITTDGTEVQSFETNTKVSVSVTNDDTTSQILNDGFDSVIVSENASQKFTTGLNTSGPILQRINKTENLTNSATLMEGSLLLRLESMDDATSEKVSTNIMLKSTGIDFLGAKETLYLGDSTNGLLYSKEVAQDEHIVFQLVPDGLGFAKTSNDGMVGIVFQPEGSRGIMYATGGVYLNGEEDDNKIVTAADLKQKLSLAGGTMIGGINMNNHNITGVNGLISNNGTYMIDSTTTGLVNVGNAEESLVLYGKDVELTYNGRNVAFEADLEQKLSLSGGTMTGDIDMNGNDLTNIRYLYDVHGNSAFGVGGNFYVIGNEETHLGFLGLDDALSYNGRDLAFEDDLSNVAYKNQDNNFSQSQSIRVNGAPALYLYNIGSIEPGAAMIEVWEGNLRISTAEIVAGGYSFVNPVTIKPSGEVVTSGPIIVPDVDIT